VCKPSQGHVDLVRAANGSCFPCIAGSLVNSNRAATAVVDPTVISIG
jgi:hypothetical protein